MKTIPLVSIVIPTLNEERNLPRVLESLARLKYPRKRWELVIVDGGSKDRTVAIGRKFGARVFFNRRRIRGAGCQVGVKKARGEVVAFTDADCVVPTNWLSGLVKYLADDGVAAVGGPNVTPRDDTVFAKAVGETIWLLTRPGARYGFTSKKTVETYHNPGCNVVYKKKAMVEAGGFNPNLLTCEDEELDFRIRKKGYKILFTPKVVVDHYRRPTYRKIFKQSYRFAIGRVQSIRLHFEMAKWWHFVPSVLMLAGAGLVIAIWVLPQWRWWAVMVTTLGMVSFTVASRYLVVAKKHASIFTYAAILTCWVLGWGLGFWREWLVPISSSPNRGWRGRMRKK